MARYQEREEEEEEGLPQATFHRRLCEPPHPLLQVTPPFKSDRRQVEYLLSFIRELGRFCADKAYLSRKVCNLVARCGGEPYISIKKNIVRIRSQGSKAWREMMLVMYRRSKKLYRKRYHRRSLAETSVSTVKRRFSHTLYSKKRRGQKNELRLKVITYNLSIIARLAVDFG